MGLPSPHLINYFSVVCCRNRLFRSPLGASVSPFSAIRLKIYIDYAEVLGRSRMPLELSSLIKCPSGILDLFP